MDGHRGGGDPHLGRWNRDRADVERHRPSTLRREGHRCPAQAPQGFLRQAQSDPRRSRQRPQSIQPIDLRSGPPRTVSLRRPSHGSRARGAQVRRGDSARGGRHSLAPHRVLQGAGRGLPQERFQERRHPLRGDRFSRGRALRPPERLEGRRRRAHGPAGSARTVRFAADGGLRRETEGPDSERGFPRSPGRVRGLDSAEELIFVDNILYYDYLSRKGVQSYDRFYYEGMWLRAQPVTEALLAGAAQDAASFWYTAWVEARKPELPKS